MAFKFLFSFDPKTNPRIQEDLDLGRYTALLLRITGKTVAGETLAPEDFGRINIDRPANSMRISGDFAFWHNLDNRFGGFIESTTPTAGDSAISAVIPFSIPRLGGGQVNNCLHVRSEDEVDIDIDVNDNTLSTRFGSNPARVEVWGITSNEAAEFYQIRAFNQNQVLSDGRLEPFNVQASNVTHLFLEDDSDVLDEVQVIVDNETRISRVDDDIIKVLADLDSQLENASPKVLVNLIESGTFAEALSNQTKVELTATGAGTLVINVLAIEAGFNSQESVQSLVDRISAKTGQAIEPSLPVGIPGLTD